ncbi:MAG: CHAT domain-containing protein, partial [Muribaculaceae bacterium]|nr:CHAT domain-containing protein [Muribaculaceae bacterium]
MIRQFIILLSLSLLSLSLWGNTGSQQKNNDDVVVFPDGTNFVIPSFEQVDTEREIGKGIVLLLDSLSKAPSFAAKDFENLACFLIDDLLSRNYLLAAGVAIHRAYNILLDPKIASEANLVGLTTSTAEMYMRGGACDNAVNYLDLANQLCNHYGEPANENYIRNSFNIGSLLFSTGNFDAAADIFTVAVNALDEVEPDSVSAATLNAMFYCAYLLAAKEEADFFADMVQLCKKLGGKSLVSALMYNLFSAHLLSAHFKNYELAHEHYEKLQDVLPHLTLSIALPDIMENEWRYDPEKFAAAFPFYRLAMEELIITNLNSFSTDATDFYWSLMARKLLRSIGLGFNNLHDNPVFLSGAFIGTVLSKNMSVATLRDFYEAIESSGKKDYIRILDEIRKLRQRIGNSTDSLERANLQSKLEDKEWPLRIGFDVAKGVVENNNKTVLAHHNLAKDECEVEIVEYPHFDDEGNEQAHYGAIILSTTTHRDKNLNIEHEVDSREFIDLGPTLAWTMLYNGLNNDKDDHYRAGHYDKEEILSVSNLIVPLAKKIEKYKRAYISASGVLNNINIGALPYGPEGKPLNETVEIAKINAVYDLSDIKKRRTSFPSAAIFSNIDYNLPSENVSKNNVGSETSGYRVKIEKGGNMKKFYSLPIDEEALKGAIRKASKKVRSYSGSRATEEAFKSLDGKAPELIHIDSHGFY